jgi:hypothetical protein
VDECHHKSAERMRSQIQRELHCPFSGERLAKVIAHLEAIARTKTIRVCCVDLPLSPCSWLSLERQLSADLAIYRSTLRGGAPRTGTGGCISLR